MKLKKLGAGLTALALSVTALVTPLSESFSGIFDGLFEKISYPARAETYGDFEYTVLDDETIKITGYTGSDTVIAIPDAIDDKDVTSIENYAFMECLNLVSVTIPNGVTSIGNCAFYGCESLTNVNLPDSVTSIGYSAFSDTVIVDNQTSDVKYVGKWAVDCDEDVVSVSLRTDTVGIADSVFSWCESLESIIIPDSVTIIGAYVFSNCESLESITIPDSVISIGYCAFRYCSGLESIKVASSNSYYSSVDGVLYNKEKTELICCTGGKTSVTIPDSVTSIGGHAFYYCSNLESITIPDGVTSIGDYAFSGCKSIASLTIPDSVKYIGKGAFSNCSSLETITIPDSVIGIGASAFYNSSKLTIECYANSAAHKFAINNNVKYVLLNPANVTGLKMTSNTPTSISMSWTKVPDATGYVVYQAINGKWERIKVTSGNTLTVSGLKSGTNYRFTVKAYKTVSGKNYYCAGYTGVWMTTTPAKPSAKMTVNTPQAIRLEWGKITGATGYVVYQQVNGTWVKKTVTKGNVYVATGLKSGTNYNFAVRAYRTFNGKNYYSPFATATDTIKTCTKPATVNFTLTAGTKKATVNWSKATGATGYIVYYKTSSTGSWQRLTTTTGTTFTKTGLTTGKTYYFTVKAYKTYNGKTYNASFTTKSVKVK